jgi:hypothetical protein
VKHTPLNPGLLDDLPASALAVKDPRWANHPRWRAANSVAVTFRGGTYYKVVTQRPVRLYRAFTLDEEAMRMARQAADASLSASAREAARKAVAERVTGTNGPILRSYWTTERPQGSVQMIVDSALRSEWTKLPRVPATHYAEVELPAGVTIFQGVAGQQGAMPGGGSQVYVPEKVIQSRGVKLLNWQAVPAQ